MAVAPVLEAIEREDSILGALGSEHVWCSWIRAFSAHWNLRSMQYYDNKVIEGLALRHLEDT